MTTSSSLSAVNVAAPAQKGARAGARSRVLRAALRWGLPSLLVIGAGTLIARYESGRPKAAVHYETVAVDHGAIAAKVTATGAVSALVTVLVGSQVSGRIDSLSADFESHVKKGQTIATIEPSLFRAAVAQARANFSSAVAGVERARAQRVQAEKQLARAQRGVSEGVMPRADLDSAQADLEVAIAGGTAATAGVAQAKAALDQTELNLKYTTIISPIDGIIISRNVDVGQTVAAALQAPTLFTIAEDLTHMQVDTNVAEADVGRIRPATSVTFTVEAYPERRFTGTVRQVRDNAQTIQNVVTYDAVIDVDNRESLLKPGMTASVSFIYATRDDVLRLPNAALRFKPDAPTLAAMTAGRADAVTAPKPDERNVWVLREGRATPASIHIGISDGSATEVIGGGLREGDRVIVEANADAAK